jgi:Cellulose binding domain
MCDPTDQQIDGPCPAARECYSFQQECFDATTVCMLPAGVHCSDLACNPGDTETTSGDQDCWQNPNPCYTRQLCAHEIWCRYGADGTEASGDVDGSTNSTSATPPQTSGLEVWVTNPTTGGPGQITLDLRIDNMTSQSIDMSTVTLRYWYQDEGLGTALVLSSNYVSIGYSGQGRVTSGMAIANPSPAAGADRYLEFSFSGTLDGRSSHNDMATGAGVPPHNDQFSVDVVLRNVNYTGAIDVTNDYSYDNGASGLYEQKITLHDQSGNVIWGTPPS